MNDLLFALMLGLIKVIWLLTCGALVVTLGAIWVIAVMLAAVLPTSRQRA